MAKAMVKYRTAVTHYVSVENQSQIVYVQSQLRLCGIESEVIDLTTLGAVEKSLLPKPDFGFQTFKNKVLR